jgi:hypothetical protein
MGFGRIAWLVPCGSDEYDVVIKFSLFGWVTSGGLEASWGAVQLVQDWRCSCDRPSCEWLERYGESSDGGMAFGAPVGAPVVIPPETLLQLHPIPRSSWWCKRSKSLRAPFGKVSNLVLKIFVSHGGCG